MSVTILRYEPAAYTHLRKKNTYIRRDVCPPDNSFLDCGYRCIPDHLPLHMAFQDPVRQMLPSMIYIHPEYRTRIVIHDFFSLKDKYLLGGIHLNSRHPEAPANYEGILSRACHSLEEVETTVSLFNYVLMSPVYDSISKQGYRSGYSKDELKQAQESGVIHEKVVALGGISEVNLAEIKSLGFGGAALLGDIWNRYHTWKDAEELLAHFRRLKKIA